jgi:hypothetical protein
MTSDMSSKRKPSAPTKVSVPGMTSVHLRRVSGRELKTDEAAGARVAVGGDRIRRFDAFDRDGDGCNGVNFAVVRSLPVDADVADQNSIDGQSGNNNQTDETTDDIYGHADNDDDECGASLRIVTSPSSSLSACP